MQSKLFNNCTRWLPLAVSTLFLLLTFCCVKVSGATYTSVGTTLTDGKSYILVANGTTAVKAETAGSNWIAGVDVSDDIDGSTLTTTATNIVWVAKKYDDGKGNITWSFKNGSSYITNGSGSTYRNMSYSDTESKFKINSSKIYSTGATTKWLQYNSTGFRMYDSSTGDGGTFVFYQLDEGSTKTLVYNANGATGGSVPTDATPYNVGDKAPVKGNTGSLYKIGHTFAGWTDNSAGTGTVYTSGDKFTIASSGNTLYAKWTSTYAGNEFSLVEDLTDLSAGSKIIIIGTDAGGTNFYALKTTQQTAYRDRVASGTSEFTMSNSNKTCTLGASTSVQVITLEDLATPVSNRYQFNVENGYLYASSSSANEVKTQTTNDANGHWQIGLDAGVFTITAKGTYTHNVLSHNNSATRFACYTGNQQPTYIYVKDEGTKYAITWANGGHGTAPTSPTSAAKVTMPELSASGWQHTGWKADVAVTNASTSATISAGTLIENGTRVQLGAATTFTAQWKQICATPTFSPAANTYNAAQTVSISCDSPSGTTIRYTTDGTNPTSSSGTVYSSAISVSVTTTIKAIAYKSGCADSEVASATYTLKCATPTFSVEAGTKQGAQSVTLSCATEGATIYYTTDGSTPTSGSTAYSSAISVTESQTIKAIAIKSGWSDSEVATAAYTIQYKVTWTVNGDDDDITPTWVNCGSKPVFPSNPAACDATSTTFIGWTQTPWANPSKIDQAAIDAKTTDATKVYTSASAMPNVVGNIEYHAVWAKESVSSTSFVKLGDDEDSYLVAGAKIAIVNNNNDKILNSSFTSTDATHPGDDDDKLTVSTGQVWTLIEQDEYDYWKIKCGTVQLGTNALATTSGTSEDVGNYTNDYSWWVISSNTNWSQKVSGCYYMYNWYNSTYYNFLEYNGTKWVSYYATGVTSGNKKYYAMKLYKPGVDYSDYITTCCTTPSLAFAASPYAVIRQDIQGASTTTWAEVDVTFTSNNTTGTISATTYTDSKTVYKMSSWQSRLTTGGTLCGTDQAYFEVLTPPSGETPGTGKFHVKTTSGQTGQGTYRIAITQASTDESHGNFCETTVYGFVDVTLRDKFVDAVNGNGTVNKDGHGAQLATPLLSEFGTQVENACHSEGRKLKGWIKETDLKAQYETGNSTRVQTVDGLCETCADGTDQTSLIVAPGANVTMSGATWYAVWAYEK